MKSLILLCMVLLSSAASAKSNPDGTDVAEGKQTIWIIAVESYGYVNPQDPSDYDCGGTGSGCVSIIWYDDHGTVYCGTTTGDMSSESQVGNDLYETSNFTTNVSGLQKIYYSKTGRTIMSEVLQIESQATPKNCGDSF